MIIFVRVPMAMVAPHNNKNPTQDNTSHEINALIPQWLHHLMNYVHTGKRSWESVGGSESLGLCTGNM